MPQKTTLLDLNLKKLRINLWEQTGIALPDKDLESIRKEMIYEMFDCNRRITKPYSPPAMY